MGDGFVSYRNNVVNLTKVRNVVTCKNKPFFYFCMGFPLFCYRMTFPETINWVDKLLRERSACFGENDVDLGRKLIRVEKVYT